MNPTDLATRVIHPATGRRGVIFTPLAWLDSYVKVYWDSGWSSAVHRSELIQQPNEELIK
jgi:hypothetical protein